HPCGGRRLSGPAESQVADADHGAWQLFHPNQSEIVQGPVELQARAVAEGRQGEGAPRGARPTRCRLLADDLPPRALVLRHPTGILPGRASSRQALTTVSGRIACMQSTWRQIGWWRQGEHGNGSRTRTKLA